MVFDPEFHDLCFVHPFFRFYNLVTFGKNTNIYKVIFVYILQGKMEKTWKENNATKVTKIPKTKSQKYGMKETLNFNFL
jgi:hypothetical protein